MNFVPVVIYGYYVLAAYLLFILARDWRGAGFFGRHKIITLTFVMIIFAGIIAAFDAHFIEPWTIRVNYTEVKIKNISTPIKIAFISDIQVGNHKKSEWVEKIVERVRQEKPDLVVLGGDLIDNEGAFVDESVYLSPLQKLVGAFPIYAVMGNHEYGIGSAVVGWNQYYTGDRSGEVVMRLKSLNIPLLRNSLACPEIRGQKICLFGIDDMWGRRVDFTALSGSDSSTPLIFITHNPDGIKLWPADRPMPDLTLAGHTHGGQVYLPLIGPVGNPGVTLPKKYFRGLNEYNDTPIFTSVGIGESGGAVRFWTLPEVVIIKFGY